MSHRWAWHAATGRCSRRCTWRLLRRHPSRGSHCAPPSVPIEGVGEVDALVAEPSRATGAVVAHAIRVRVGPDRDGVPIQPVGTCNQDIPTGGFGRRCDGHAAGSHNKKHKRLGGTSEFFAPGRTCRDRSRTQCGLVPASQPVATHRNPDPRSLQGRSEGAGRCGNDRKTRLCCGSSTASGRTCAVVGSPDQAIRRAGTASSVPPLSGRPRHLGCMATHAA